MLIPKNTMTFNKNPASILAGMAWFLSAIVLVLITAPHANAEQDSQDPPQPIFEEYRLGPADVLEIFVWKEGDLNKTVVVRPDGGISFPLAGNIHAAGKTIHELEQELTKKITPYIPEVVLTVSLQKVAGYRVYVMGKVRNPGEFVLGSYVNITQALTLADGLTPYASEDDIKVIRKENGTEQVFEFDYTKFSKGKNLDSNIVLKSGDVVVVP